MYNYLQLQNVNSDLYWRNNQEPLGYYRWQHLTHKAHDKSAIVTPPSSIEMPYHSLMVVLHPSLAIVATTKGIVDQTE
jgi:hypothetical protein